jgi:hypothetical protein
MTLFNWVVFRTDCLPSFSVRAFRSRKDAEDFSKLMSLQSDFNYEVIFVK